MGSSHNGSHDGYSHKVRHAPEGDRGGGGWGEYAMNKTVLRKTLKKSVTYFMDGPLSETSVQMICRRTRLLTFWQRSSDDGLDGRRVFFLVFSQAQLRCMYSEGWGSGAGKASHT